MIGGTRLIKRAWQIYVAHVFLLVIYIAEIGVLARHYHDPNLENEFNVAGFMADPANTLAHGLILAFKPVNMDVLPLYILLMAFFPIVLWVMLRRPNLTLAASFLLYLSARHFDWNLASYPTGTWYFNPFCWQFLFVFGGWFALGGANQSRSFIRSRTLLVAGSAYLAFALLITMAGRIPELGQSLPTWLLEPFSPNDKSNLAPYRIVHFVILAFLVTRFMPRDWVGLKWPVFRPMIKCGQQSLEVFCSGIFLAFIAHLTLVEVSDSVWMQILVSVAGVALMTVLAYYRSWSRRVDKAPSAKTVAAAPAR